MSFSMGEFIACRRDRGVHSAGDLTAFARLAGSSQLPDYQIAAWLMAAVLNPLSLDETVNLTLGMAASGETLDLASVPSPVVDKHSTGGVGDKTTLVVLPILAACGVRSVKMSGRGLGITGGTLDKLACVPGFRLDLSPDELISQAATIGLALAGQSPKLAPADKVLYALRDATETVASMELIVSSILSKKIAGGAKTVVLEVKCGSGAFMQDLASANELKKMLEEVGQRCGLAVAACVSDMDQPLGQAAGNAMEVREAIDVLEGKPLSRPSMRFRQLAIAVAGHALTASGRAANQEEGLALAADALTAGRARAKAEAWFLAQGAKALDVPFARVGDEGLEAATIEAERDGWVLRVDAGHVGTAAVHLGAGRMRKEDPIDGQVGIFTEILVGDEVKRGQIVFRIRHRGGRGLDLALAELKSAVQIVAEPVAERPLLFAET